MPGCWALAGQVFALEYSDAAYREVHGLTVDAYAVQHQGEPERRTINSLCFHLIGLHLALDLGLPPERTRRAKKNMKSEAPEFQWLTLDDRPDWMTINDVLPALTHETLPRSLSPPLHSFTASVDGRACHGGPAPPRFTGAAPRRGLARRARAAWGGGIVDAVRIDLPMEELPC